MPAQAPKQSPMLFAVAVTHPLWGLGALIKHRASSVAPLTMCFQLRAASDHSGGFVQTQGSKVTEKHREGGEKEATVSEDSQVLHKI